MSDAARWNLYTDWCTDTSTLVQCHNNGKGVIVQKESAARGNWVGIGVVGIAQGKHSKSKHTYWCTDTSTYTNTVSQHKQKCTSTTQETSAAGGNRVGIGVVSLAQGSQLVPCSCYFSWHLPSTSPHHLTLLLLIVMRIGSVSDLKTHSGEKSHFSWHLPSISPYHHPF